MCASHLNQICEILTEFFDRHTTAPRTNLLKLEQVSNESYAKWPGDQKRQGRMFSGRAGRAVGAYIMYHDRHRCYKHQETWRRAHQTQGADLGHP